jgi:CHAT domain-containing protein
MKNLLIRSVIAICALASVSGQNAARLAADGQFAEAAKAYLEQVERSGNPTDILKATLNAASCMKLAGDISAATRLLADSRELLDRVPGDEAKALFLAEYGSVLAMGKKPSLAVSILDRAAVLAGKLRDDSLLAEIRNDLGIALAAAGKSSEAFAVSNSAMELASHVGMADLAARARQNRLLTAYAIWKHERESLVRTLETNPPSADDSALRKGRALFESSLTDTINGTAGKNLTQSLMFEKASAGIAAIRFGSEETGFQLLEQTLAEARATGQQEIERSSLLALAEMYLDHGRREDASLLLDHFETFAHGATPMQLADVEILHSRCELLPGGSIPRAKTHAERAVRAIENLRGDIAVSQPISNLGRLFREWAGLPYLILADIETRDGSAESLKQAQRAIESYKAWELDDFFQDDCVNLARETATDLSSSVPESTAVLYVISLPDRVEILVGTSRGVRKWTSQVPSEKLSAQVRLLRYQLEFERGFPSYLPTAEYLHEALISPCIDYLRKNRIRHLVFVPEGPLASIPIAVLRDPANNRFLLEDFSLSISPGLTLLPNESTSPVEQDVLLAGVSDGVQGFVPLPGVGPELERISAIRGSKKTLLNGAFTKEALARSLIEQQATTIHLASHAEFSSDPDETFLLTHDGRLTMNDLERLIRPRKFKGKPVDLLCLSACRTAAGDDRAALGLAGAAIKSGARSVVASLWYVDDAASSTLMVGFHRNLASGKMTKADALRKAQLDMIRADPYIHPYIWAPFILIGDWK